MKNFEQKYFYWSFWIFLFSFFFGVLFVVFFPAAAEIALNKLIDSFSDFLEMDNLTLGFFIFINNSVKIFLSIILGLLFAIPTIVFLIINGFVLGWVVASGGAVSFLYILPHGVFELTALFIGASMGIKLGSFSFKKVVKSNEKKNEKLKNYIRSSIKNYFYVILPLLAVAALVEMVLIMYF